MSSPNPEHLREAALTAARGHNLSLIIPPSPAYATPVLESLLGTLGPGHRALLLCPPEELDEWGRTAYALAGEEGPRVQVAHGIARAARRLAAGSVDLVIAAPETALALVQRAALKAESLASVFLAWPERWAIAAGDPLAPLMQDLPKESQRIIVTAAPEQAREIGERYARRALTVGTLPETPVPGNVRIASAPWRQRIPAVAQIVELLDPASLVIWTADASRHEELRRAVPLAETGTHIVTGDAPAADVIVAFDLPTPDRLAQLFGAAAREVIVLAPPSTAAYVDRLVSEHRPLRLPGLLDAVMTAAETRRAAIAAVLEQGTPDRALAALAPLFERYDAAAVAAALFELWTAGRGVPAAPLPDIPAIARVYLGLGRKDGVTVNDIVAALTKDIRVERIKIGKIELHDAFALVELPAQEAETIARALTGTTIRRKRVSARIDRGRPRTPQRPAGQRRERR